jgi:hypothetical protein
MPRAKDPGKILGRVPVDGNAERMNGLEAGFGYGLTHVLHAVAALVVIDIIGFPRSCASSTLKRKRSCSFIWH